LYLLLNATANALPLAPASVDTVVSSPPFWGLRSYGTFARVWGGSEDCAHSWGDERMVPTGNAPSKKSTLRGTGPRPGEKYEAGNVITASTGAYCVLCGAWRGELGSEPALSAYVANMVQVCRELRRVLTPTGVLFLEIGDSRRPVE
jgi:hypothetical protein